MKIISDETEWNDEKNDVGDGGEESSVAYIVDFMLLLLL